MGSGPAVTVAAVGLENGVIYVTDVVGDQIMSVDPATGARTLVSGPGRGKGPAFVSPIGVTSDSPDSIVVLDRTLFASYLGAENYALLLRPVPVQLP